MTDEEHRMIAEVHAWLFKAPIAGQPTRVEQLDQLMAGVRAGKLSARVILWLCGAIVGVLAAYNTLKGLWS